MTALRHQTRPKTCRGADGGRDQLRESTVVVRSRDGVEIAYTVAGAGDGAPAVVFVHGWAGNRSYWHRQVDHFADRYQVVAVDLGGHGESGLGRHDWNLAAFGDDVLAVVHQIDAPKVALVGHSMGGDAILHAASQLGDRVAGLVWVDVVRSLGSEPVSPPDVVDSFLAPFRTDFAAAVTQFARSLFPPSADHQLVDRVAADMIAAHREVSLGSLQYALNREPPMLAELAQITAPVVAINPDVAPTDTESFRRHGIEPIVLRGVGHYLMLEDPGQFNRVLEATLAAFDWEHGD